VNFISIMARWNQGRYVSLWHRSTPLFDGWTQGGGKKELQRYNPHKRKVPSQSLSLRDSRSA